MKNNGKKFQIYKRSVSLMLAMLILAGAAVSCSDKNSVTESDSQSVSSESAVSSESLTESESEIDELAPEVENLNGVTFTFLNYTPETMGWANALITVEEYNGEVLNDALYERELLVESLYKCEIEEVKIEKEQHYDFFTKSVVSGISEFDVSQAFDASVGEIVTSGNAMSWNNLDIDLDKDWWDRAATSQYNFGGIQVAVTGAYSLYNYSTRHCYVFNEGVYEEHQLDSIAGTESLYELVSEGGWTLDKMYEMAKIATNDTNGDGNFVPADDFIGITGTAVRHYSAIFAGAGLRYVETDSEGKLTFNVIGNETLINTLMHILSLEETNVYNSGATELWDVDGSIFTTGHALFQVDYLGMVSGLRGMESDFGIVPPPKYSEEQENYYSIVEGGALTVLPKTLPADKYDSAAVILDALGYYSSKQSLPAYIEEVLKHRDSRNAESVEMIEMIFDNSFYDHGVSLFSTAKMRVIEGIIAAGNTNIASYAEAIGKLMKIKFKTFENGITDNFE